MDISAKIHQIQTSSPANKLRWVILCSTFSFLLIVGIWILFSSARLTNEREIQLSNGEVQRQGMFARLEAGTQNVILSLRRRTANTILYFQSKIYQKNTIIIDSHAPNN